MTTSSCAKAHQCGVWRRWRGWGRSSSCSVPACWRIPRSVAAAPPCRPPSAGSSPSAVAYPGTGWRCPHGPDSVGKQRESCVTGGRSRERNEVWYAPCRYAAGGGARSWTRRGWLLFTHQLCLRQKSATLHCLSLASCWVSVWLFTSVKWTSCVAVRLKPCWLLSCCSRLCERRYATFTSLP